MGGTIDNNVQCVRRAAESLDRAPYLLSALKARGHERLAGQIEARRPTREAPASAVAAERAQPARVEPARAEPAQPAGRAAEMVWLQSLPGSDAFAAASNRRAKVWLELGVAGSPEEVLFLKTPAAKGKREWVLKRTWPDDSKRKAEYVAAGDFRGIACYLIAAGATHSDIERLLKLAEGADQDELVQAAGSWRAATGKP